MRLYAAYNECIRVATRTDSAFEVHVTKLRVPGPTVRTRLNSLRERMRVYLVNMLRRRGVWAVRGRAGPACALQYHHWRPAPATHTHTCRDTK
ncbi:hypothetical protein EVAR_30006_1 [Eumeta japonica]|uniref:Uncharacterized protein n=1 Tax=Eumeta variegata TaxID=151549 RepID=A0A4C1VUH6_EUMVA|nr:hypothetical protein EVAR_30006_1 [Eumeta japonica]